MMKYLLLALFAVVATAEENLRGNNVMAQREAVEGYPILPEHLDFNPAARPEDFVIEVTGLEGNRGEGGLVQARESPNTPAMVGQGIALSLFTVEEGGQNLIHYHPRATELLYVIKGTIEVGFTTTTGELIANTISAGQATLFPRGLLHFQRNIGQGTSQYISMLNSENPGVMSFPRTLFTLPTNILSQAFRKNLEEVARVQGGVIPVQLRNNFFQGVDGTYDNAAGPNGNAPVPPFGTPPAGSMGGEGSNGNGEMVDKQQLLRLIQNYLASNKGSS